MNSAAISPQSGLIARFLRPLRFPLRGERETSPGSAGPVGDVGLVDDACGLFGGLGADIRVE